MPGLTPAVDLCTQEVVERASTELGPLRPVDPADFLPRFAAQLPFGQPRGGSRYSDGSDGVSANVRPRARLRFYVVFLLPLDIQTPSRLSRRVRAVWSQEDRFTPESPGNKARRLKGASLQDLQGMQPVVLHLRALQDGVDKHGKGKWAVIRDDAAYHFNNRSSVDLKDKHRNLTKNK